MIPVETALAHLFDLVAPLGAEEVPLRQAAGRILARPVAATRDQPPFRTAVMDGYAVRSADIRPGATLRVVAEAAAGHEVLVALGSGEAIRIFTGAPMPDGADRVVIQEDTVRDGDRVTVCERPDPGPYVRPAGKDFRLGDTIPAPRRLTPADLVLAASMNLPVLPCTRRPEVAVITTGDELVQPGETPRPDQIIASNTFGLAAMLEAEGAAARVLPIARDTVESLETVFGLADGADMIVTIGGASVGDHDLVQRVARGRGMEPAFYTVAMRPGKPLMAGRMNGVPMIGLPGNPVSSMVCGKVFVLPALRVMLGLPAAPAPRLTAALADDIGPNGPREHYMRARLENGCIRPFAQQDSGLMGILASADALLVRPPHAAAAPAGSVVEFLPL